MSPHTRFPSSYSSSSQILLLLLACMVGRSVQVCAPDCAGVDPGTLVRDPTDCTRYYACLSIGGSMVPSVDPIDCPDGEYFNEHHTVPRCDPISLAPDDFCQGLCNPCVPDCHPESVGTVQPHPIKCNNYYVCLEGGHVLEETCPPEVPSFDFLTGNCQTDNALCYDYCDPCVPHCTTDGEKVPDPYDCHGFYYCSPPEVMHFLCPSDQVFDQLTQDCVDNVVCDPLCSGRPPTTTATTTIMETPQAK